MPVKVLYLVRSYAMGGVQRLVQLLLTHLPRDEFEIITIPYATDSEHDAAFLDSLLARGIDIPTDRIPWRGPRDWFRARRAIRDLTAKYNFDIVHSHDDQSNMLVGVGNRTWPCARVASVYGWFEANLNLRLQYTIERRLALPHFDRIYTVSHDLRRKIVASGTQPDRVQVIHTGLQFSKAHPSSAGASEHAAVARAGLGLHQAPSGAQRDGSLALAADQQATLAESRSQARQRFGIPSEALVVGTVSRLSPEKGHRILLQAAGRLLERHPQLYLLCAGTGNQLEPLKQLARELQLEQRVILPGFVGELEEAFAAMDLFALPSILDEGFPTVCLEAQLAGLPVVASNIGGTRETIDENRSGILVPPGNVSALAAAIDRLLTEETQRKQMGQHAQSWVETTFTLDNMLDQMCSLYRTALSHYQATSVSK